MNKTDNNIKSRNALVAGVARNCTKHIKEDILRLQLSLEDFNKIYWLIIESDSTDDTLAELEKLKSEISCFSYISLGVLSNRYPLRTERIAFCRNVYIKELKENQIYQEIDIVVIADMDGLNKLITKEAISSCFERNDWDVCTSNQRGHYYDIWALRHKAWCPNDCWKQAEFLQSYGLDKAESVYSSVYSKMLIIDPNMPWIEVDSAFGGLAIYRRHTLENVKYIGVLENGDEICEHVTLHKQIKDKGFSIYINPALINAGHTEHANYFTFSNQIKVGIKSLIQRFLIALLGKNSFNALKLLFKKVRTNGIVDL